MNRQISLEQLEDAAVLIRPRRGSHECMIFDRINRKLPARLAKLDESLGEPYDILKMDIGVYHSVRHQQRVVETFREVNRR